MISVKELVEELIELRSKRALHQEFIITLEEREDEIVEELHKFYTTPPEHPIDIIIVRRR